MFLICIRCGAEHISGPGCEAGSVCGVCTNGELVPMETRDASPEILKLGSTNKVIEITKQEEITEEERRTNYGAW